MSCEEEIFKALGDKLPRDKIKKIVKEIEEYGLSRPNITQADMLKKAMKMAESVTEAYEWHKFNMVRNESLVTSNTGDVDRLFSAAGDAGDALKSLTVGSDKMFDGARLSTAARQVELKREFQAGAVAQLEKGGLLELAQSGELDAEIATELLALQSKGKLKGSGNETAKKIAAVYNQAAEKARLMKNEVGINVKELSTHIAKQTHDRVKLRGGAFFYNRDKAYQKWREYVMPRLDIKRTFGDVPDAEKALKEIYDNLLTGDIENIDLNADIEIGSNKKRALHFKDGAAFVDYNRRYGSDTLFKTMMNTLGTDAFDIGLVERWGSKPDTMYKKMVNHAASKIDDPYKKQDFITWATEGRGNGYFKQISGAVRGYDNMAGLTRANLGAVLRDSTRMGLLGGAQITSFFGDSMPFIIQQRKNGVNLLGAYGRLLQSRMNILKTPGDKRQFMDLLGAAAEGAAHHPGRITFNDFNNAPGLASKMTYFFMKYTGNQRVMDIGRGSAQMFFARDMAMRRKEAFGDLAPEFREQLSLYGIKEKEWANFAEADVLMHSDGGEYAIADGIKDKETQRKFGLMFSDMVDYTVLSPGAKQNYFNNFGYKRGTWRGEAWRFAMQFKSFGITHLARVTAPAIRSKSALTMGHLAVGSLVGGYMVMATKGFLQGKDLPDVDKPETWTKALAVGGFGGAAGDYYMGLANFYERNTPEALAGLLGGPVGQDTLEFTRMTFDIIHGVVNPKKKKDISAKAYRELLQKIPGNNMPVVRTGLDYLFLYAIQEELSPGSLRRMERNLKERTGQEFFYPPSRAVR